MIIFGTKGVKTTLDKGLFSCPQCATQEDYKHIKVTKFFTLYFIPLIPLGKAGEYVECKTCKGTFIPRVLQQSPSDSSKDFQAIYEEAMRNIMVSILLADGKVEENEVLMAQKIINKYGHNDISITDLKLLIAKKRSNQEPLETYLKQINAFINEHGKEVIIKCCLAVAIADDDFDQSEYKMIVDIGKNLDMSPTHFKAILEEFFGGEMKFSQN